MSETSNGNNLGEGPSPDEIGRLLRLAQRRPPVPPRDAALVKEAVRAEWRRAVKAHRRRLTYTWGARGLLAAAAVVLVVLNLSLHRVNQRPEGSVRGRETVAWLPSTASTATVEAVTGSVVGVSTAGAAVDLQAGDSVRWGTSVETGGDGSPQATLRLGTGARVVLGGDTRLRLRSRSSLFLHRGALYLDTGRGVGSGAHVELWTPAGVVRDVGTRFEVAFHPGERKLRAQVREGVVALDRVGETHLATAGEQLELQADGRVVRSSPCLPLDHWYLAALEPRGEQSLEEFLRWVAEECGCGLRTDSVPQGLLQTRVYLAATDLSLKERLESVLLGLPLAYTVQDEELVIEPAR